MSILKSSLSALLSVSLFAVVLTAVVVAAPAQANNSPLERGVGPASSARVNSADGVWSPQPQLNPQSTSPKGFLAGVDVTADYDSEYGSTDGTWDIDLYAELMSDNYDESFTSEEAALTISRPNELASLAKAVNEGRSFDDKYVKLNSDIDLSGVAPHIETPRVYPDRDGEPEFKVEVSETASKVWEPIGNYDYPFNGNFNGNGHKVENMVVLKTSADYEYIGLFGYTEDGTLENIGVADSTVVSSLESSACSGVLVGSSSSSITNSYATGDVFSFSSSSLSYAGGLVGKSYASITNSYATGDVYSSSSFSSYAGGLAGSSSFSISNSYATGDVFSFSSSFSSSFSYAGGLAGSSSYASSNSYATGDVFSFSSSSSSSYAGGLVGHSSSHDYGTTVNNSYAAGDVYSSSFSSSSSSYAGGLVGNSESSISNSYATGDVFSFSSSSSYAGGLVGNSESSISNSYATGDVYSSSLSSSYAGGLAGSSSLSSSISNSYATGNVYSSSLSSSYAGGLVGESSKAVFACFSTASSIVQIGGDGLSEVGGLIGFSAVNTDKAAVNSYYDNKVEFLNPSVKNNIGTPLSTGQMQGVDAGSDEKMKGLTSPPFTFAASQYPKLDLPLPPPTPTDGQNFKHLNGTQEAYLSNITINAQSTSKYGSTPGSWDETFYSTLMSSSYNDSYFSEDKALVITNPKQLAAFSKAVNKGRNFKDKFVSLGRDIDLDGDLRNLAFIEENPIPDSNLMPTYRLSIEGTAGNVWTPVGNRNNAFSGTFNGKGFSIYNMVVIEDGEAGLFGIVGDPNEEDISGKTFGLIENVGVVNSTTISSMMSGGLAGTNSGDIINSYATGNIYSRNMSGGLAGINSGDIINSYATGNIYSSVMSGGLAGINSGDIINSRGSGNTFGLFYSGGLAGQNNGDIINSYATGNIYSSMVSGGLVGTSDSSSPSSVTNSYATGDVYSSSSYSCAGGITGYTSDEYIRTVYSAANNIVSRLDDGEEILGGIVGYFGSEFLDENVENSYYDSHVNFVGGGTPNSFGKSLLTTQMQGQTVPSMINFTSPPWTFESGQYPKLDIIPTFTSNIDPFYEWIGTGSNPGPLVKISKGLSDSAPEYEIIGAEPAGVATIDPETGQVTLHGYGSFKIKATRFGGSEFQAKDVSVTSETIKIVPQGFDVYRVFNASSGEHHYTKDHNEYVTLIGWGWTDEGKAWHSPRIGDPVYRVFNSRSGEHHYTKDRNEFNTLVAAGWTDEGIAWYSGGTKPVMRVFNSRSGEHHYTRDINESNTLISWGWTGEGVGWMAVS